MKLFALCLFCLGLLFPAWGQKALDINLSYSKGFVLQHTSGVAHLAVSHPTAFSLSLYKRVYGEMPWQSRYNYPDIGATLIYLDYHNPILGKSIGIIPNYNFHFSNPEAKINGHFKIGLGPGYHTNPYDRAENNKNNAFGTALSYGILLQTNLSWKFADRISAETGISLVHFSNGSIKKPNTGINVVAWSTGLTYSMGNNTQDYKKDTTQYAFSEKWHISAILNGGVSETLKIGTGSYPFFNIQIAADKQLNSKRRISAGVEYFHTLSLREEIKNDYWLEGETPDFKRFAVVVGYEQLFNKLSAIGQVGFYLYSPYKAFEPFYVRIGLRHALSKNIFAGISVKSHYFKAEAAEWSVGYRFY